MRKYLVIAFLFFSYPSFSQKTYPVPVAIFDSLVWEALRGRECNHLQIAQAEELKLQGEELLQTNKALQLSLSYSSQKETEVIYLRSALQEQKTLTEKKVKQARRKSFKAGIITGVLIGLVGLLL